MGYMSLYGRLEFTWRHFLYGFLWTSLHHLGTTFGSLLEPIWIVLQPKGFDGEGGTFKSDPEIRRVPLFSPGTLALRGRV